MEENLQEFIRTSLAGLEPLTPRPTTIPAVTEPIPGIRAVLFDIYGTLLISASGDVDTAGFRGSSLQQCFERTGITVREPDAAALAERVYSLYEQLIREAHQRARQEGIPHPEVDILVIWEGLLRELVAAGVITVTEPDYLRIAFLFELTHNAVYPMPGLKACLAGCRPFTTGIISNAQFYTPIILDYFLNNRIAPERPVEPFEPELCFYSYRYLRGKPDVFLYRKAAEALAARGIRPEETLYVGNDMLKDVLPAATVGFKTVLFAGDQRSLRLREEVAGLRKPDAVIKSLKDLERILL